jgi:type VI protein secretion system component Hcp
MSDDINKIDEKAAVPAASTELSDESLQSVAGGADIIPKEQVSLSFGKIEVKYQEQKSDGKA